MASASDTVWMLGLDIGSTTMQAMLAQGRVLRNSVTGRMELGQTQVVDRTPVVYTPFCGDELDAAAIERLLDDWIAGFPVDARRLFAGGALLTGLAAQAANAATVAGLVRSRFEQALVVTADDPRLESWLAFMGNCPALSHANASVPVLNLDIGGGTTNPAWGINGQVRHVGCYLIGARHIQLDNDRRIRQLTPLADRLLEHIGVHAGPGDRLSCRDLDRVLDFHVAALEAVVRGDRDFLARIDMQGHEQVAFEPPRGTEFIITLSGGVGELAYRVAHEEAVPTSNIFGDLGIDLALRICQSPLLSKDLTRHATPGGGQATVFGVALHTAELSGATVFLPDASLLPLGELPIIGSMDDRTSDTRLQELLELARAGQRGACLQIETSSTDWQAVKELGQRLASGLQRAAWPADSPLVLLVRDNIGKTLGQYVTDWQALPYQLLVLDELPPRQARFVSIGKAHGNVVPVSYFGLFEG